MAEKSICYWVAVVMRVAEAEEERRKQKNTRPESVQELRESMEQLKGTPAQSLCSLKLKQGTAMNTKENGKTVKKEEGEQRKKKRRDDNKLKVSLDLDNTGSSSSVQPEVAEVSA